MEEDLTETNFYNCFPLFEEVKDKDLMTIPPLFLTGKFKESFVENKYSQTIKDSKTLIHFNNIDTDLIFLTIDDPKSKVMLEFNGIRFDASGTGKILIPRGLLWYCDIRIYTDSSYSIECIMFKKRLRQIWNHIPVISEIKGVKFRNQGGICCPDTESSYNSIKKLRIKKREFESNVKVFLDNDVFEYREDLVDFVPESFLRNREIN